MLCLATLSSMRECKSVKRHPLINQTTLLAIRCGLCDWWSLREQVRLNEICGRRVNVKFFTLLIRWIMTSSFMDLLKLRSLLCLATNQGTEKEEQVNLESVEFVSLAQYSPSNNWNSAWKKCHGRRFHEACSLFCNSGDLTWVSYKEVSRHFGSIRYAGSFECSR